MRLLHVMLRVRDLDRSIQFYTEILGMEVFSQKDYPSGRFTLAFLGYGSPAKSTVLELTHNWETDDYMMGDAYGHIAIEVNDVYEACKKMEEKGGKIIRSPGPMKDEEEGNTILAFIEDPDGYKIELLGKVSAESPISHYLFK